MAICYSKFIILISSKSMNNHRNYKLEIFFHWTLACLQNYKGKQPRELHYAKFPCTHNEQHDKTFLVLARKHQNNSFAKTVDFIHSISFKKKKDNNSPRISYFLSMRNFCYCDCLRTASNSEFHTPGSYCSRPVIKAMQNTDITGCTVVHLLTCLTFGFKKHQLFRTLQLIINREKYQESLFLQAFRLVIKSQVICFSLELSS